MRRANQHDATNSLAALFQEAVGVRGSGTRIDIAGMRRDDRLGFTIVSRSGGEQVGDRAFERGRLSRIEHPGDCCRSSLHQRTVSCSIMLVKWGLDAI